MKKLVTVSILMMFLGLAAVAQDVSPKPAQVKKPEIFPVTMPAFKAVESVVVVQPVHAPALTLKEVKLITVEKVIPDPKPLDVVISMGKPVVIIKPIVPVVVEKPR